MTDKTEVVDLPPINLKATVVLDEQQTISIVKEAMNKYYAPHNLEVEEVKLHAKDEYAGSINLSYKYAVFSKIVVTLKQKE